MNQNEPDMGFRYMTRRIGGTIYKVKVAFSETIEYKILRMIRNEVVTTDGICDTMDVPQIPSV